MTTLHRILGAVAGLFVLSCILACGAAGKMREAADRAKTGNDLKQLYLEYVNYNDDTRKWAAGPDELLKWPKLQPTSAAIINDTRPGGRLVFLWGAKIPQDFPQGTSQTIIGFDSKTPTSGGMVLMGDGAVQFLDPQTFAGMPRPTPGKK
jgi:hypothetical protein